MMMVECALNLITGYRHWLQTSLYTHFQFHTRLISQRWNEMWTLSTADGPHFKYGKPIEPEASDRMKVLARITKLTMYENFRKWEMIDMTLEEGTITVCVCLCKKTSFCLLMLAWCVFWMTARRHWVKSSSAKPNTKSFRSCHGWKNPQK